jgi:DNA-binding LytR/AlgR family response regulator
MVRGSSYLFNQPNPCTMSIYTAVIIDDERNAALSLQLMIEKTGFVQVIGIFQKPEEAVIQVPKLCPDIIFLDIQMPKLTGMETAELLQKSLLCRFIFTTGYKDYAFDSFQFNTIDYLLKPIAYTRLLQAITKALTTLVSKPANNSPQPVSHKGVIALEVLGNESLLQCDVETIEMVCSNKNYISIWLNSGKEIKTRTTLKAIESLLPSEKFIRVHRGYIINITAVRSHTAAQIILKGSNQLIPVSRINRNQIKRLFR